ncbi:MAG: preprotein translocase subunit YajC [Clostridia bacterium]|nr:preprotein translocase subunit YajC [Clostridia bacterium]
MNFLNLLAETKDNGSGILLPIIMVAFIVLLLLTSIIPQKKRQKQMANMLANLKAGDEIKTIGGMVGKITAIDEATGILTINVGTANAPTYINIDKVAIYSVASATVVAPTATAEPVVVEESKDIVAESADVSEVQEDK